MVDDLERAAAASRAGAVHGLLPGSSRGLVSDLIRELQAVGNSLHGVHSGVGHHNHLSACAIMAGPPTPAWWRPRSGLRTPRTPGSASASPADPDGSRSRSGDAHCRCAGIRRSWRPPLVDRDTVAGRLEPSRSRPVNDADPSTATRATTNRSDLRRVRLRCRSRRCIDGGPARPCRPYHPLGTLLVMTDAGRIRSNAVTGCSGNL
jgi:hypothetical protein